MRDSGVALRPIDWHPIQRKKRSVTCSVRKWLTSVRTGHVVRSLPRKLHNRLQTTMIFVTHEQTEAMTRRYINRMKELGHIVPVHYQEPFRRSYGDWAPEAADFERDLRGAVTGGAAGWCFHNGDEKNAARSARRRSFDLREKRLYEQWDEVETSVVGRVRSIVDATEWGTAR